MRTLLFLLAFQFQVPPGWVDLSPGAPQENFSRLPPQVVKQIREGNFAFYAADIDHATDGFMENVNASVDHGTEPVTQKLVDEMAAHMGDEVAKQAPDVKLTVLEKNVVDLRGVPAGRLVIELSGAMRTKQVQYLLPGVDGHAVLTYSTTPEDFARYQPIFDAAAIATGGVAEPPSSLSKIGRSAWRGALIGGLVALVMIVAGLLAKRRKTS
jgi:hypothetical protein